MSGPKILLFLLSVYALLAGVCLVFPEDGYDVFGAKLRFPSISDVEESLLPSRETEEQGPSPEELLAQRQAAIRQAEEQRYETFMSEDPARFYFPDSDCSIFDDFFAALDNAGEKQLRILHYGDSQIEEDRITGTVRAGLQKRFGGSGPGLLPFGRPYYTLGFSETSSTSLYRTMAFSDGARRSDSRYGVMGQCCRIDTSVFTSVSASKKNDGPSRSFRRLTLLAGNVRGSLNLSCNGQKYKLEPVTDPSGVGRIVVSLPDSTSKLRFSTWGSADIYGMQLDDTLGVCVDNIPMRSCSGTVFTRISSGLKRLSMFRSR